MYDSLVFNYSAGVRGRGQILGKGKHNSFQLYTTAEPNAGKALGADDLKI